jgi:hypothetical protein
VCGCASDICELENKASKTRGVSGLLFPERAGKVSLQPLYKRRAIRMLTNQATPGTYPIEHEDASDAWKRAYDRAARNGCTEKASTQYADSFEADFAQTKGTN